jgi:hypothetical protein
MRLGSAASVGMRLDRTVSRDQQLLRIQAFIMTGKDALFFESNAA